MVHILYPRKALSLTLKIILLVLVCLMMGIHSFSGVMNTPHPKSYSVTAWRYMNAQTLVKIEFDFDRWLVFICDGRHVNDLDYVFAHGCVLTAHSGEGVFPLTGMRYISTKDEARIKTSLNLNALCNK